ncbi:MAG: tyrosine-type recombinase/integrase [Bradymonadaceae bacterium]
MDFVPQLRVRLHGKGDKWRVCPLWSKTASLLQQLLEKRSSPPSPESPVFTSRNGSALTRFGIYKIVRRHAPNIMRRDSTGQSRSISPHIFRHTAAVHLLEAGVDPNVIRAWLGHARLETTNRYAEITLRMKAEALAACEPPVSASSGCPHEPIWRDDKILLNWLRSL